MDSDNTQWVLGLSIDEEITWGLAPVNRDLHAFGREAYPDPVFPYGKICDLPNALGAKSEFDLSQILDFTLDSIASVDDLKEILQGINYVGVSTIGVVNPSTGVLQDIRRKALYKAPGQDLFIDFRREIQHNFNKIHNNPRLLRISVQNDATARCLSQYRFQSSVRRWETLCYVHLSTGINIGLCNGYGPIASRSSHPELGHMYPSLFETDKHLRPASLPDCPTHHFCFEGLLSANRFYREFGTDLPKVSTENKNAWDAASHYGAQLCWTIAIAVAPDLILVGGPTASPELIEMIRYRFNRLNTGEWTSEARSSHATELASPADAKGPKPYIRYDPGKIQLATRFGRTGDDDIREIDGLMAALEMARFPLMKFG